MSIRKYTITNILGSIIPIAVTLVTVPLYLDILGDVRYGVLTLVWLIMGYFGFLEMGLGKATANHISKLPVSSIKERGIVFWNAIYVNVFFGLVAALILWSVGTYLLTNVLKIPNDYQTEAIATLPWLALTLPLALVSSVLVGALEGCNRFFAVNLLQVINSIIFQIAPLLVGYYFSPSLAYIIPTAVVVRASMNVPFFIACFKFVPLTRRFSLSWDAVRSLLSFGGWVAVTGLIAPLLETIDRLIIGAVIGAQAVTYYTLPYQLVTKIRIIPASLSRSLFPQFSADNPVEADKKAFTSLCSLLIVMTPIIVFGIILLKPFMNFWIGKELSIIASPLGEILLLGVWINSLAYIPYSLLQGKGRPEIVAKLQIALIVPFLLMLFLSIKIGGEYGAACVWSVRIIIDAIFLFRFSGILRKRKINFIIPGLIVFTVFLCIHVIPELELISRFVILIVSGVALGGWLTQIHRSDIMRLIRKTRQ